MSPEGLRSVSLALLCMGIAAAAALGLSALVWHLAGWALVLLWIVLGLALDLVADRAGRGR